MSENENSSAVGATDVLGFALAFQDGLFSTAKAFVTDAEVAESVAAGYAKGTIGLGLIGVAADTAIHGPEAGIKSITSFEAGLIAAGATETALAPWASAGGIPGEVLAGIISAFNGAVVGFGVAKQLEPLELSPKVDDPDGIIFPNIDLLTTESLANIDPLHTDLTGLDPAIANRGWPQTGNLLSNKTDRDVVFDPNVLQTNSIRLTREGRRNWRIACARNFR